MPNLPNRLGSSFTKYCLKLYSERFVAKLALANWLNWWFTTGGKSYMGHPSVSIESEVKIVSLTMLDLPRRIRQLRFQKSPAIRRWSSQN